MGGVRSDGTPLAVEIMVEQDEDGRFAAWSPSLPGCATFADTREEAVERAREAVEAYLDDVDAAKRSG
ncbi:MAG: type II toxin-antitoxin system HicB family antitoxin [Deltaproteobacteria bacterium]|nr:type II toxin-antitoxin system HicB family antitoxin [Deltaproteobacteria bacterium]